MLLTISEVGDVILVLETTTTAILRVVLPSAYAAGSRKLAVVCSRASDGDPRTRSKKNALAHDTCVASSCVLHVYAVFAHYALISRRLNDGTI